MASAQFSKCSEELRNTLDNFNFGAQDFWEGYKLYCFGHYSKCSTSKLCFRVCKMGRVMCQMQDTEDVAWGALFDEAIRQAWAMMEEYVQVRHGKDCTNLRALMEEYEDVGQLSTSPNGRLLLKLIEDDAYGTERLHKESLTVQCDTDIFEQIRVRLKQAQVNLNNLQPQPNVVRCRER